MRRALVAIPLLCLLVYVVVRTAWMADDAYITFRVADNWLSGHGLRWNTYERVQAYTNPLWMLVAAAALAVTRESFITLSLLQIALSVVAGILLVRGARTPWSGALALLAMCLSRAYVDFSASGMENTLAHVIGIAWAGSVLRASGTSKSLRMETTLASLLMVTRLDLAFLVAPALGASALRVRRAAPRGTLVRSLAMGLLPLVLWELFSFIYYGSFIPNSARAKLTSGIPQSRFFASGLSYFSDSLRIDPLTLTVIAAGVISGIALPKRRPLVLGLLLMAGYVCVVGGDFMSGRFFTIPFAIAAVLVADWRVNPRALVAGAAIAAALAAKVGAPTITDRWQRVPSMDLPVVDCRLAFHLFTGLTEPRSDGPAMTPNFIRFGRSLQIAQTPPVLPAIGIAGYFAGPDVRIIDAFALSDPLRARLPIPDAENEASLKMGHFMRPVPEGYVDTIRTTTNVIRHPDLHAYYDDIAFVTQGPIFSASRLIKAFELEVGLLDESRDRYLAVYSEKPVQLKWLPPEGSPPQGPQILACYTWWRACAETGYTFTETGLRIILGRPSMTSHVTLELTPGSYELIFRFVDADIGRQELTSTNEPKTIEPPVRGYDTIAIKPSAKQKHHLASIRVE